MRQRSLLRLCVLGLGIALAGCGMPPDLADEIDAETGEIISGTNVPSTANYFNVAVYHRDHGTWFGRPCSGMLLDRNGTWAHVLTAYHCVSRLDNGPSDLRLTMRQSPGLLLNGAQPPAEWVPAYAISVWPDGVITGTDPITHEPIITPSKDLAIISVQDTAAFRVGLTANKREKPAIFLGPVSLLSGRLLQAYGYGRASFCTAANGPTCEIENANSGAGILRTASGFPVITPPAPTPWSDWYEYVNGAVQPSGFAATLNHGDSGGPSTMLLTYPDGTSIQRSWRIFSGVHIKINENTGIGFDASYPRVAKVIHNDVPFLYLTAFSDGNGFLRTNSTSATATVSANSTTGDVRAQWKYDFTTHQIKSVGNPGSCLQGNSSTNVNLAVATCSTSNLQKWDHQKDMQLKNVGSGLCLRHNVNTVRNASCAASAEVAWAVRVDNK